MSNSKFIDAINRQLAVLGTAFTGARVYGLAQSVVRSTGDGDQILPAVVDLSGEEKYVGLDDAGSVTIYHKANTIAVSEKSNSGYGDRRAFKTYLYGNTMIVFLDRQATKLLPEDFILFLEANLEDNLKMENYRSVIIRIQNIILNSAQVFDSEYKNVPNRINPRYSLFAINYQIESVFDKSCFATCP